MSSAPAVIYAQQAWSLDDLFPAIESDALKAALAGLETLINAFEANQSKLDDAISPSGFHTILDAFEEINHRLEQLNGFAELSFAADTQDQQAQIFLAQINQVRAESRNRILFFELWWKDAPEAVVNRLLPTAGDYGYWLEKLRMEVPHTLSEPEERVINLKNVNGRSTLVQLYESITNRYTFDLEVDGQAKTLLRSELSTYYSSEDPAQRKAAYQELIRVFSGDAPILGQIYQALARDWRSENVDLRHFNTPISAWNLKNNIPDEVVATLLSVAQGNRSLFHRYFSWKAKWLGMDTLRRCDIYAPVADNEQIYEFTEAAALVLGSFQDFDPLLAQMAQRVFAENHFDSENRPGKDGGAFCATPSPDLTPWVLQSFHGQLLDVNIMAHELGHAIHAMLSAHHTSLTQHSALPLAETASIFSELLLTDHLLAKKPSLDLQRALLGNEMDVAFASILRQVYFSLFELEAYEAIYQGATIDSLCGIYLANLKEQFGDAVTIADNFQYEWLSVPHFYQWPFYVYAYAFGHLLVLALYDQYQQEGEPFKARYLDILAAGGSAAPVEILAKAGIDVYKAEFWQGGFDVLAKKLEQLENLERNT